MYVRVWLALGMVQVIGCVVKTAFCTGTTCVVGSVPTTMYVCGALTAVTTGFLFAGLIAAGGLLGGDIAVYIDLPRDDFNSGANSYKDIKVKIYFNTRYVVLHVPKVCILTVSITEILNFLTSLCGL